MEFNIASVVDAVGAVVPDRECLTFGDRRLSYRDLEARTNRFGNVLVAAGVEVHRDRSQVEDWESGQDHVAVYCYNGNEYLEAMLGSFKARAVPVNVNWRYVQAELLELFLDMQPRVLVIGSTFAPTIRPILAQLPSVQLILQIDDGAGNELLAGAVDYEAALAQASPEPPPVAVSPDDAYMLYTGGTTGRPKGVLWRQADLFVAALSGRDATTNEEFGSIEEIVATVDRKDPARTVLPLPPFMHGGGHWVALGALLRGNRVVVQRNVERLDPVDVWTCVERERVNALFMIGDAFARPLLAELERGRYDLSSVTTVASGGAALNARFKQRFLELIPGVEVVETGGASETGGQLASVSSDARGVAAGTFEASDATCVISEDKQTVLPAGHGGIGWLARGGRLPLGYLHDREKTSATFPTVAGVRMSVPGDRARHLGTGLIELLGRESVTINSGGEKIFAEEVEQALADHEDVLDVVVCGRTSERWGQEVVALVQLRPGADVTDDELLATASRLLARYKLPKAILRRDVIVRSPTGKADYRWAREQVGA